MRSTHAVTQRLAPRGSIRTRGSRIAASAKLVTAALVAVGSMTAMVVVESAPASASTVNGIASIADPVSLNVVTSGASTTPFTVSLPPQAACDADTATHGYHVYSYLVPSGTNLSAVTFESFPSTGYGLVDNIGTYYGPVNTAIGTGQIVSIPNNFQWGPLVANDSVPLSTLLYSGAGTSATGIWEAGLVCANNSGAVADNWNTEVTFHAASADPNGFTWTAVPGPSGSSPAAITSASSATFTRGFAGTFAPTATGSPSPVFTESGTLPAGVTLSGGVLAGTPTVSGTFPITLTATNGIESPAKQTFTLTVTTAVPSVTAIAPAAGPTTGGSSVVISGTNLASATAVDFGATPATITADSATSITATAPAGTAGPVDVTVTTPGGTSTVSANDLFTFVAAPTVNSVAPTAGPIAGGTSVVIAGTNLDSATAVDFGSTPATITSDSATSITATAPAGSAGPVDVTVTTLGGTSATSANDLFTYGSAPAVTGIAPSAGPTAGGTSVVISGTNLASADAVDFGATAATITANSATSITATAPAGSAGPVDVTVTTPDGTSVTSANDQFTYADEPTVTGIAPTAGPTAGGTSVVISGANLASATTVDFGTAAATVTADSATSITATAPVGSAGPVDVTVTTAGGTSATSPADLFTYGIVPAFTSATSTTFVTNTAETFTPAATGTPAPVITESGTLPGGVTFTGGVLSGTPTATGSFPISFVATNGIGAPVTQSFTLTVAGFEITTTSLPDAVVGTAYSQQLVSAGSPAGAVVTWKKVALPKGFALSASGVLSGTPSPKTTGPQSVKVSLTDAKGGTPVTATIPLTIDEASAFAKKSPVAAGVTEGTPASITVSTTGYPAATYTLTGSLPAGLSFDQATGVLSGTPTVTTDSSQVALTIEAANGSGIPVSETFTLSVYAPLAITTAPLTIARGASPPTGFQLATVTGTAVGGTAKVKATGLPKGLTLSANGVLSGTVSTKDATQTYTVTVTASSKDGKTAVTASATTTITVTS